MKSPSPRSARRHAGFTLIELLTVIAIIGILAAILIPTVGSVREKAKQAQCVSNLRNWAMAVNSYAADNRGNYYITDGSTPWTQISVASTNPYKSYFKVTRDFGEFGTCPSKTEPNVGNTPEWFSYTMVRPWMKLPTNLAPLDKVPLSRAEEPSRTLLLFERYFTPQGNATPGSIFTTDQGGAMKAVYETTYKRHGGRVNAVAMDMHVIRMRWFDSESISNSFSVPGGASLNPLWFRLHR